MAEQLSYTFFNDCLQPGMNSVHKTPKLSMNRSANTVNLDLRKSREQLLSQQHTHGNSQTLRGTEIKTDH